MTWKLAGVSRSVKIRRQFFRGIALSHGQWRYQSTHRLWPPTLAPNTLHYPYHPTSVARVPHPNLLVLEVAFATKELRSVCEDGAVALEVYGQDVSAALWSRLADLRAASHPLELPFAASCPGAGGDAPHVVIELSAGFSLVLAANHRRLPLTADCSVAWEHVSRVLILRLDHPRD